MASQNTLPDHSSTKLTLCKNAGVLVAQVAKHHPTQRIYYVTIIITTDTFSDTDFLSVKNSSIAKVVVSTSQILSQNMFDSSLQEVGGGGGDQSTFDTSLQ